MNDLPFITHNLKLPLAVDIHIYFNILYQKELTNIVDTK